MSKSSGIAALVGENVIVRLRDQRTEEITGEIIAVTSNGYKISYESRGSTYTYMIPFTIPVYAKTEIGKKSKFEKGDEITAEIAINRIIKVKGNLLSADENGFVLSYESRHKKVQDYFAVTNVERVQFAEATAEGKKLAKAMGERMKASREGGKKSKKSGKVEKAGKKKAVKLRKAA